MKKLVIFCLGLFVVTGMSSGVMCSSKKHDESTKKSSMIQELSDIAAIHSVVASNDYVVIKFSAPWCPHCVKMDPKYHEAAGKFSNVVFCHVNMDNLSVAAHSDSIVADVQGLPTLKLFKKGSCIDTLVGYADTAKIEKFIKNKVG